MKADKFADDEPKLTFIKVPSLRLFQSTLAPARPTISPALTPRLTTSGDLVRPLPSITSTLPVSLSQTPASGVPPTTHGATTLLSTWVWAGVMALLGSPSSRTHLPLTRSSTTPSPLRETTSVVHAVTPTASTAVEMITATAARRLDARYVPNNYPHNSVTKILIPITGLHLLGHRHLRLLLFVRGRSEDARRCKKGGNHSSTFHHVLFLSS